MFLYELGKQFVFGSVPMRNPAFCLLLATAACQLQATPISIVNSSFESVTNNANTAPCLSGGTLTGGSFIDAQTNFGLSGCIDPNPLPGWSISDGSAGVQAPQGMQFPSGIPDGANEGYSNGGLLSQTLTEMLRAGTYTLQVDIGNRLDTPFLQDYTISLLAGGNTLDSHTNFVSPARGTFQTDTLLINISAANAQIGQLLQIQLSGNSQANFDKVRLDGPGIAAIPEPTPMALISSGMFALFLLFRGRKLAD